MGCRCVPALLHQAISRCAELFEVEIGDVLADTVSTSTVILSEPLPVGASAPQAPKPSQTQ